MPKPKVSAIIPTMNRPEELIRAVKSVKEQTYNEIEIVIIEEGEPEPQIPSVLEGADISTKEFTHLFNPEPSGLATARNQAVSESSGKYLAFLDDDDEWYPTKIEKQVLRLSNTDADICYTGVERIGPDGNINSVEIPNVEGDARSRTLRGSIIGPSVFMVSREAYDKVGGFDDEIPYWEDWDFLYRMSKKCYFTGVHEVLAKIHADAEERLSDSPVMAERGGRYLIEKHTPINHEAARFATRKFKSRVWQGVGRSALMNGRYSDARRFLTRALQEWPFDRELILYWALSFGGKPVLTIAQTTKRTVERKIR